MTQWRLIGEILRDDFKIEEQHINAALSLQQQSLVRLGEILLQKKWLTEEVLARALAVQQVLTYHPILPDQPAGEDLLAGIPIAFAKENRVYPIGRHRGRLVVAMADPLDLRTLNDLATLCGAMVEPCIATSQEILRAINRGYEKMAGETREVIEEIEGNGAADLIDDLEPEDLLDTSDEAPIIRFVNNLIKQGYRDRASDIHIEPYEKELVIRYRIDGILYEVLHPPIKAHPGIVSRIKIMSHMNIAEKRLPQDGRFRVRVAGSDVDIRVSTLPTAYGERVVLRLLDKAASILSIEEIGMDHHLLRQILAMINRPHGVFLVTGPTGSGKTTTLYSALGRINHHEKNLITVEDPIEYELPGVAQIQVNPKIGLTFANGLRSILRQDPDVIMVGEIRDRETAEIVVQSALTGHMVFSTLHTNDAAGALTRLVEMDIEPFLAASSIVGILAQRLVRRICPHCREQYHPPAELVAELGEEISEPNLVFYRGQGCQHCMNIGYWGRTGIYELLSIDDTVRELLLQNRDAASIRNAAIQNGMQPLRSSGLAKVRRGDTSIEEVLRVTRKEV